MNCRMPKVVCASIGFIRQFARALIQSHLRWIPRRLHSRCLSRNQNWRRPAVVPEPLCNLQRLDLKIFPPDDFVAGLMQLPMMTAAERDGELVADFQTQRSGLGKSQVVRIGWLSAANQARL